MLGLHERIRQLTVEKMELEQIRGQLHETCQKLEVDRDVLRGRVAMLEVHLENHDRLRAALIGLVERLDLVHNDPAYKSVWMINQLHVGPYTGPNYVEKLQIARHA